MQQGKLIDPIFQNKIKFDVVGENGRIIGEVFLLDRSMLPHRRKRKERKAK